MHRGAGGGVVEELLAISPPPEFQDLPAPPPVVFRDLSPCSATAALGSGSQGQQGQKLWDFASRISFDILNEAMVIATEQLLSQHHQVGHGGGGCSTTVPIPHPHFPHSSESSGDEASNPSSVTTSWEYLSKTGGCRSSGPSLPTYSSNGINRSTSFHSEIKPEDKVQYRYGKRDKNGSTVRHSIACSYPLPLNQEEHENLVYKGPSALGDVYSLPIDNLSSPEPVIQKPIAAPRRARSKPNVEKYRDLLSTTTTSSSSTPAAPDCLPETSRLHINSKSRESLEESTSTKPVKRTIGHSILNLFKRKSRSKADNSILRGDASFYPLATSSNTATTSRALPSPPPTVDSYFREAELGVRISYSDDHQERFDLAAWSEEGMTLNLNGAAESPVEAKDFAASIEKVKDCGWYWGPLSSEAAEDLLRGEPDGSFIVRDSSDAHYIFSLTFKLNGLVRHVRIEHDQGNFSFGPLTRFKASTIVDFVEKAVAHSRSGRYLFFLHRRPVLGPMRVQLLHPYSRFRHPRSLQHMCRFVILKYVRRDLIASLPLPKPLQEYLNTPHYYFEKHEDKKFS